MDLGALKRSIDEGTYDVPSEEVALAILRWFIPTDLELEQLEESIPPVLPSSERSMLPGPRRALERKQLLRMWQARQARVSLLGVRRGAG